MCAIMALVSCFINAPYAFNNRLLYVGDFTYVDSSTGITRTNQLYVLVPSEFASSNEGTIITIALFVIRDIFTLVVGMVLNIALLIQMRKYLIERARKFLLNTKTNSNVIGLGDDTMSSSVMHHQCDHSRMTHLTNGLE